MGVSVVLRERTQFEERNFENLNYEHSMTFRFLCVGQLRIKWVKVGSTLFGLVKQQSRIKGKVWNMFQSMTIHVFLHGNQCGQKGKFLYRQTNNGLEVFSIASESVEKYWKVNLLLQSFIKNGWGCTSTPGEDIHPPEIESVKFNAHPWGWISTSAVDSLECG